MIHPEMREFLDPAIDRKIVLLVLDGLGGLPHPETGLTELETARLPNFDRVAARASGGRMLPVALGVTPGSGPAHLALFGYHPYEIEFGRGALEALGSEFDLRADDLAARANFATVDAGGIVRDRRAGRPADAENQRLCAKIAASLGAHLGDVEVHLLPGKEHRFTVVFRGAGLGAALNDNDPQRDGLPLLDIAAADGRSARSAAVVAEFLSRARDILADERAATGVLLRGFSGLPCVMPFNERYGVRSGAIAAYPMYRGVAAMVGMDVLGHPENASAEIDVLAERWSDYDFFFIHYKPTDAAGHSGDFGAKVEALEAADALVPRILELGPEAFVVTGDHSTPSIHKEHSWHPVPTLIHSRLALPGPNPAFTERALMAGDLGVFHATDLLPLALAYASRLKKYGA